MKIEVLFPEFCNLYGDMSNIEYLHKCIPEAEIIYTSIDEEPAFLTQNVNLIYLGPLTERKQEIVINKLKPYKEKIEELINNKTPFLFTGNAVEVLGKSTGDEVYGFTMPLVTDSQGNKFGKSEGNALWLDKEKTSSYELYQFFVNVEDVMVIDYLKIYTFLSKEEIEELDRKNKEHPELREAHKALAREIITFLHGKEEYEKAVNLADHLFNNKFNDLSKRDIEELFKGQEVKEVELNTNIVDFAVNMGIASSKREAREFISSGAISINGEKVTDLEKTIDQNMFIENTYIVARRGKKNYYIGKAK